MWKFSTIINSKIISRNSSKETAFVNLLFLMLCIIEQKKIVYNSFNLSFTLIKLVIN